MPIPTAQLHTDSVGFAQANFVYPESGLAGFEGATVSGLWTLVVGGTLTVYDTQCISITIG